MKKIIAYTLFFGIFTMIGWTNPRFADAHGTGCRVITDNKAVTAEFYYSDGEVMSYAAVLVFSPQDDKTEYQNGRTDRLGRFAFYPDAPGTWHIEANDGMGHKAQRKVDVPEENSSETSPAEKPENVTKAPANETGSSSVLLKCVAGLSLLFNIYFGLYLWKRKN